MLHHQKSNEEEVSLCFQAAMEKLDNVDADAKKQKRQIVQDLAKDLKGKIPTERIASEIVHQLRGKVSERLIHDCLDEEYKEKHRVNNARKQKRKHQSTEDLAALVPLKEGTIDRQEKKVVVDTLGNEVVETQHCVIKETDYDDDKSKSVITQSSQRGFLNCETCPIKEQLEDALRRTTRLTLADQIPADDRHDQIIQLQNELKEVKRQLEEKTSQNAKLSDEVQHFRELQTEVYKDENHNTSNIAVTNTGDFEFSLLLGDIKYRLTALYPRIGDAGKVWFSGKLDKDSGKIHSIRFGRIGDNV